MPVIPVELSFWILVHPVSDVPGQWVGHCLDLDIVSVGDSREHATQMVMEAVSTCLVDDLEQGRQPFELLDKAPQEHWDALERVTRKGTYSDGTPASSSDAVVAGQLHISIKAESQARPSVRRLPPVWMMEEFKRNSEIRAL